MLSRDLESFLNYKESKIKSAVSLESQRLKELQKSRTIVFKYALPLSLISSISASLEALLKNNFMIFLPVIAFVILIFLLANSLDSKKTNERIDIMLYTDDILYQISQQEIELLKRV